jgi:SlyX protein|tara:strand:+ start:1136 stop:1345 length:210 start_codon:yes stop_codon:yes gene_type:complete
MTNSMDARLEELETKVTFQEDLLVKLDDMLVVHQKDISSMRDRLELLTGQLQQLMRTLPEEPESPPPHY